MQNKKKLQRKQLKKRQKQQAYQKQLAQRKRKNFWQQQTWLTFDSIIDMIAVLVGIVIVFGILFGTFFTHLATQFRFMRPVDPYNWFIYGSLPLAFIGMFYLNTINMRKARAPYAENNAVLSIDLVAALVLSMLGYGLHLFVMGRYEFYLTGLVANGTAPLLLYLYFKIRKIDMNLHFDYAAIMVFFIWGMAKLGCHTAGCCRGFNIDLNIFTRNYFPAQIIESAANFALVGVMAWCLLGSKRRLRGLLYPICLIIHCAVRFTLEFFMVRPYLIYFRDLPLFFGDRLNMWQLMSLAWIVGGGIWLAAILLKRKFRGKTA